MTSTKTSVDNKYYSSLPYFRFNLKQNWQQLVLFLIIALFVMLLPSYIAIQSELDWIDRSAYGDYGAKFTQADIIERTQNNMRDISVISLFVSAGLASISGMAAMSYVNSKKSVGCYHSFPIKRESIYVIETATPVIYYLLSILAGYALSYVMFFLSVDGAAEYTAKFFTVMLAGILLYLFIYTAFLLAGGLTGTNVMKFFMVLILLFLPVAVYLITAVLVCDNSNLYNTYYLSIEAVRFMAPIINLIYSIALYVEGAKFSWVVAAILSALMYVGALLLYKYRKSELSGTTVVWKPVFIVVKYIMIFSAALLGAWISFFISDQNIITVFFGMVFGGVIGLVLMNSIMYRSTRAMFKDFKKFLICLAVTFVFVIFIPFNATGMIGRTYPINMTKSITIGVNDGVEYKEHNTLEAILDSANKNSSVDLKEVRYVYSDNAETMLKLASDFSDYVYKDYVYSTSGHYTSYGEYYNEYGSRVFEYDREPEENALSLSKRIAKESGYYVTSEAKNVVIVQKPYFGIPLAKSIQFDINGAAWDKIINSDEYIAQYNLTEIYKDVDFVMADFNILGYGNQFVFQGEEINSELFQSIISECVLDPAKRQVSALIGWIYFNIDSRDYSIGRRSVYFPIYSCDVELINAIGANLTAGMSSYYTNPEVVYKTGTTAAIAKNAGEAFMSFKTENDVLDYIFDSIETIALANAETTEAVIVENTADIENLVKATSSVYNEKWSVREFTKSVDTDYVLLIRLESGATTMVHFRPDTVTNAQLEAIFNANK